MDQSINLLELNTVRLTTSLQVPGEGVDAKRELTLVGTFSLMEQDEFDALCREESRSEVLRRILKDVSGVAAAKVKDPDTGEQVELSPVEVAIRYPLSADALFTRYVLYIGENGRNQMVSSAERKNSKRSRKF